VRRCRAFIFDFDGLLADTEGLHYETIAAVLGEEGISITREENDASFLGVTDAGSFEVAFAAVGRQLLPAHRDALVARKAMLFHARIGSVDLFPAARSLVLEALARGPCTIASSGARGDIEAVLARHSLSAFFPRFVSAGDVARSKPEPDCFLKALDLLREPLPGLQPGECLVFEDSPRGIEAARRAGMRCCAVAHTRPAAELAAAEWVIGRLGQWRWW